MRQHVGMDSGDRQYPALESAVNALMAAVGSGASTSTGVLLAAAAGAAVAPTYRLAVSAFQELGTWRLAAADQMLGEASVRLSTSPEDLVHDALTDPEAQAIFADALHAAARTFSARKVRGLAVALANGLADDKARIDESHLIIRALADLEEPHIRLLSQIADSQASFTVDEIADQLPGLGNAAALTLVATFERHALLMPDEAARRAATAEMIKRAQGKVTSTELQARRSASLTGLYAPPSNPLSGLSGREWFELRDQPAWVVTDFARLCWAALAEQSQAGD